MFETAVEKAILPGVLTPAFRQSISKGLTWLFETAVDEAIVPGVLTPAFKVIHF